MADCKSTNFVFPLLTHFYAHYATLLKIVDFRLYPSEVRYPLKKKMTVRGMLPDSSRASLVAEGVRLICVASKQSKERIR